jgi:hypothetical protein
LSWRRATSARVSFSERSASLPRSRGVGRGRPLLLEALVLAAATQHLGPGVDAGLEVEDHGVVRVPDEDGVALPGRPAARACLDPEPVEPVGEEADGLVVAEVGLPDPALGLLAAHPPAVARSRWTVNSSPPSAARAQHDPLGATAGSRARRGHDLGHRERQLAQPSWRPR